ncbi:MAG: bifunctional nuclease family protein [Planctomycetota bacterium]
MDRLVEVELARIIINETSDQQYIFLREKGGQRQFPIVISTFEAAAIDRYVKEAETPRPLTHELLHRVIEKLGCKVLRIEVTKLEEGTFYANLVLGGPDGEVPVDARPSDAVAIAVRNHCPIFVNEDVIEEVVF